ncbi:hypothetical protein WJX81_007121 [Elliptochloris bilobata]|uniref:AB hydrolase-1 domain-containing protein n=1 Tax=Elliptochloris bilobata TaxID=381761 RepID=A0AAW1RRZ3_9CHLO
MHGAIQGGWVWNYSQPLQGAPRGVKGLLETAGFRVFNPTLPCHSPSHRARDVGCTVLGRVITAQVYVDSYLQVMRANGLSNVTLVAHSLAGVWAQLVVQQEPDAIERIIFLDAVILKSGESFALNHIGWPAQGLSTLWLGEGTFRQGGLSYDFWRDLFVQTRNDNQTFLNDTYARLVPEPRGPCLEHLNMDRFFAMPKLKVYIIEDQDISISVFGTGSQWATFAGRLWPAADGADGGLLRLLHADLADHQGMLTQPVNVARAIAAATAIGRGPVAGAMGGAEFAGEALNPEDASAAQVASATGKGQTLDDSQSQVMP